MARKKGKRYSWRRWLLIFVGTPLAIWFLAFVIWFFWPEIQGLLRPEKTAARLPLSSPQSEDRGKKREGQSRPVREDIPEEDRKRLDALLKQR